MCKKLLVVLFVLSVAGIASATNWNLIGYWKFDVPTNLGREEINRADPLTRLSVWNNGGVAEPGILNGGIGFNGAGYMLLSASTNAANTAWLEKLRSTNVMYDFYVYGKSALGFQANENFAFSSQQTDGNWGCLGDLNGSGSAISWLNGDNNYQQTWSSDPATWGNLFNDKWAHVQLVYEKNAFSIYVNGILRGGGMVGGPSTGISLPLSWLAMGASPWGSNILRGTIDEFKVFTPEPTTICLLGLGGLALLRKRR